MNKAILISIRPEHLVNILNGEKTLELRKTAPFPFSQGRWVYIYCTKSSGGRTDMKRPYLFRSSHDNEFLKDCGADIYLLSNLKPIRNILNGKVVARFWFDTISPIDNDVLVTIANETEWTSEETDTNFLLEKMNLSVWDALEYLKGKDGYAWHIKKLEIFDKPKELSDFYKANIPYIGSRDLEHALEYYGHEKMRDVLKYTVKKPPQSWQYVYIPDGWL